MKRLQTLKHKFVEFVPEVLESGILYVSVEYTAAVHKFCRGCGFEVVTPIIIAIHVLRQPMLFQIPHVLGSHRLLVGAGKCRPVLERLRRALELVRRRTLPEGLLVGATDYAIKRWKCSPVSWTTPSWR